MIVLKKVAELDALPVNHPRGAVFTMGALHEGHLQLMHSCRELIGPAGQLLVTIFVNPTQFNDPRDLERYPRTPDRDLALCESAGVDVVFMPDVAEMYPAGVELPQQSAGELGSLLEGASRPGHFDAVATVVHRLISVTRPDISCFGEKDYQQLVVVKRMVETSRLDCAIVGVPTVRSVDGLALSSRNALLSAAERESALVLNRALRQVVAEVQAGGQPAAAVAAATKLVQSKPGVQLDYLVVTDDRLDTSAVPKPNLAWNGRALIAARVGTVRLIDNLPIQVAVA